MNFGIVWVGAPNRPFAVCDSCAQVALTAFGNASEFRTITDLGYECRVCGWAIKPVDVVSDDFLFTGE